METQNNNSATRTANQQETSEKLTSFISDIIKSLVVNTENVEISSEESAGTESVQIKVSQEDMGRVIGHAGCRIQALRVLSSAVGAADGKKVRITLVE